MILHAQNWGPKNANAGDSNHDANHAKKNRIVLLHGMGGTGGIWRPVAAVLEDAFEILAPDQRGHGKSRLDNSRGDFSPMNYGRDVVDTMDARDFHPAVLVGHSMGVRTACAVAHLQPQWVAGLVLIDLGLSGPAGGGIGDSLSSFIGDLALEYPDRAAARAFLDARCPDPSIAQYLLAVSITNLSTGKVTFPFDSEALLKTIDAAKHADLRPWIQEAAQRGTRILMLRGERSLVWKRSDFERERESFAHFSSIQWIEIPGTGHGLPFEKRQELATLLRTQFS
ncbi:MAG: alpha/beta fold hydrolase [Bacteriovoracia bacterium]